MFLFFKGMDVSIVISEPSTRNDTSRSRRSHKQGHSRRSHTSHKYEYKQFTLAPWQLTIYVSSAAGIIQTTFKFQAMKILAPPTRIIMKTRKNNNRVVIYM
jgi:hypothetical protein